MRRLSAHEVLRLAPNLPGTEVRAFFEPFSNAVQVMFVGVLVDLELDQAELGITFELGPALDGRYQPTSLADYPEFRWQAAVAGAYGNGIGAQVRAWAIEAYESHLNDLESRLHVFWTLPGGTLKQADIDATLDRVRDMRRKFRARVGAAC